MKLLLFFIGFFYLAVSVSAQKKYEREYRMNVNKVPEKAREYVNELDLGARVRWYFEENEDDDAIEAKVISQGKDYSIEFDTEGNLEDIEIEIAWSEIPEETRKAIQENLSEMYSRHKIKKIQIHYEGDPEALKTLVNDGETDEVHTTQYEIVVEGKKGLWVKLYEKNYSLEGRLNHTREIVLRNTDNLEY